MKGEIRPAMYGCIIALHLFSYVPRAANVHVMSCFF